MDIDMEKLLKDKRVVDEIHRHLWIESEKAGSDIGFEKAKEDWLKNFSRAWMQYHMPAELTRKPKAAAPKEPVASPVSAEDEAAARKRRAKSYVK
jgi:hypothetical protein